MTTMKIVSIKKQKKRGLKRSWQRLWQLMNF
jgi:hypothetical protein